MLKSIRLTDSDLGEGDFVDTTVTNGILVLGLMEQLNIEKVNTLKINLADGVLSFFEMF